MVMNFITKKREVVNNGRNELGTISAKYQHETIETGDDEDGRQF